MGELRTRKPTGEVAWPLLLVEGEEKAGKSFATYELSADPRVGRTFVLDLGEGTADEYARLGPYEVLDHNGTYGDMVDQVRAVCHEPMIDGKPNVLAFDSLSMFWDLINDWKEHRARNSRAGRRKLEKDPDAELEIPVNLHNDGAVRFYRPVNMLRRSNVIGVLIARGKETAKVVNGQPVSGETDYRVEAHKGIGFVVTAQVRMVRPHQATLVGCRSLDVEVPANGLRLPDERPLAHLVFDLLKAGSSSVAGNVTHGVVGIDVSTGKRQVLDLFLREGKREQEAKAECRKLWAEHIGDGSEVTPEQLAAVLDAAAEAIEHENGAGPADQPELPDAREALDEARESGLADVHKEPG